MKKVLRILLSLALAMSCFCFSAAAVEGTAGIYGIKFENGYESLFSLRVQRADGTEITATTETVNGISVPDFYPRGVKLRATYTGAETAAQYLILVLSDDSGVPTDGNIAYIDQDSAGGNGITFTVYPAELSAGKVYSIYLSSNAQTGVRSLTKIASFRYYVPFILGDVDEDGNPSGRPTANDALLTLQASVGNQILSETQQLASDANRDGNPNGRPTAADALLILQASVGKVEL